MRKKTCRGCPDLTWSIRKSFPEKVTFERSSEGGGRVNRLGRGGENLAERMLTKERSIFQGQGKEHSVTEGLESQPEGQCVLGER